MKAARYTVVFSIAMSLCLGCLLAGDKSTTAKEKKVVCKDVQLNGKREAMSAFLVAERKALQIKCTRGAMDSQTNMVVAEIAVAKATMDDCDFAMGPSGELLWVYVNYPGAVGGHLVSLLYALRKDASVNDRYEHVLRRMRVAGKEVDVPDSLDLAAFIRQLALSSSANGHPLVFERGSRITNVRMESTNDVSVNITGSIGSSHEFRGVVILSQSNQYMTTGFAIQPILPGNSDKSKQIP
jgi:hypothetical protein